MAYSETIKLVTGDHYPLLTFTLKDSNTAASGSTLDENDSDTWAPLSLSGSTVRFRIRAIGSTTVKETITATITDASNGVCTVEFPTDALDTAGTFEGEIEITNSSSKIQTVYDLIKLSVRADFD